MAKGWDEALDKVASTAARRERCMLAGVALEVVELRTAAVLEEVEAPEVGVAGEADGDLRR